MHTVASRVMFVAFFAALTTGTASAQLVCGIPAEEAVIITWEGRPVFGDTWRIFTPAGAYVEVYSTESRALEGGNGATLVCEVRIFDNFEEFTGRLYRLNRPLYAGEQDARQLILGVVLAPTLRPAPTMCAECDVIQEKLSIIREKYRILGEGLQLVVDARAALERNASAAGTIGAAYLILQSLNISLGVATLPCFIRELPRWLARAMGGAQGLGAYVQGDEVTVATMVGVLGGGVALEVKSTWDFMREYGAGLEHRDRLRKDMDRVTETFEAARVALAREQRTLEEDSSRARCPGE